MGVCGACRFHANTVLLYLIDLAFVDFGTCGHPGMRNNSACLMSGNRKLSCPFTENTDPSFY
jgi:hypothetical protein